MARLGTGIGVQAHFIFGKSHGGRLLAVAAPL
jgi:hypothetical protein